jgi:type II secretory pathway component GspD/PulD (secretin)
MLWQNRFPTLCLPLMIGCLTFHASAQQPAREQSSDAKAVAHMPAMAELELTLAEWTTKPLEADSDATEELLGSSEEVAQRLAALEQSRKLTVVERYRLTTVEGAKAILQSRERVPVTVGVTLGRSGTIRNIVDKVVGTQLMLTLAKGTPNTIQMELSFEKSRLVTDPQAPPLAETAQGEKILATSVATLTIQTAVRVARGKTAAVAGHSSDGRHYVLLVSALGENKEK